MPPVLDGLPEWMPTMGTLLQERAAAWGIHEDLARDLGPALQALAEGGAEDEALLAERPEASYATVLRQLQGTVRWVKVGLEMYTACGPDCVREIADAGFKATACSKQASASSLRPNTCSMTPRL